MDGAVLLLEGLLHGWIGLESVLRRHRSTRRILATVCSETITNEVSFLGVDWGAIVGRSASESLAIGTLSSVVVGPNHLLVKELIGYAAQAMCLILLLPHLAELSHVDKSAVENDLGLRVVLGTLQSESLDSALRLKSVEQILSIPVNVTEDDSLVALTIRQSELLKGDLVLLGLSDRHLESITDIFRGWQNRSRRALIRRLTRLFTSGVSHGLERHILDTHGHWDRVDDLLEGLWLERLRRLSKSHLCVMVDCLRPLRHHLRLVLRDFKRPLARHRDRRLLNLTAKIDRHGPW